jgi:hypothetical protein
MRKFELANTAPMKALLYTLAALLGFALLSCGGSSPTPPPPNSGFTNASLKGQYAFLMSGVDIAGAYLARIGSFTADGAGNITAGLADGLDLSSGQGSSQISITGGSYSIQTNGRGTLTLQSASGSLRFSLAMQSISTGYLVQTDLSASSSGSFTLQSPANFSVSSLANHFVFDLSGVTFTPSAAAPISLIGEFNPDGAGTVTGGVMDTNNGNLQPSGPTPISPGTYAMDSTGGSSFGRGTMTFNGYTFAFYIIDSTHIVVMEEDRLGGTSGNAFLQSSSVPTQNSEFNGSFVYLQEGASVKGALGPVVRVTRLTSDGNGNLGSISLDDNNNGRYTHVSQGSNISKATYSIDTANSGSGRGALAFTDSGTGTYTNVFYLVSPSQGFIQVTSAGIIDDGPLMAQSPGPFALNGLTGNFVFSWRGEQLGVNTAIPLAETYVGPYALSSASSSNIGGIVDYVQLDLSGQNFYSDVPLGGTLTINNDGTANNRYKFAINGAQSSTINFQAYFVNSSTVLMVTSDSNHTTAGFVNQQSVP